MSPNITLPLGVYDQVYAAMMSLYFFASVVLYTTVFTSMLVIWGIREHWVSPRSIEWTKVTKTDTFQLRVLIALMNLMAFAYALACIILYFTPVDQMTWNYCNTFNVWGNYLYDAFYLCNYTFLFKRTLIANRVVTRPSWLYRLGLLVAAWGAFFFMPGFMIIQNFWNVSLVITGFCYDATGNTGQQVYYLVGVVGVAIALTYTFLTPLLQQQHPQDHKSLSHNATQKQFTAVARRNAILALVSVSFQSATSLLFLVTTIIATVDTLYLAQVANVTSLLDVMVSDICAMLMTTTWMPNKIVHISKIMMNESSASSVTPASPTSDIRRDAYDDQKVAPVNSSTIE